jgi:hypothetical protein
MVGNPLKIAALSDHSGLQQANDYFEQETCVAGCVIVKKKSLLKIVHIDQLVTLTVNILTDQF